MLQAAAGSASKVVTGSAVCLWAESEVVRELRQGRAALLQAAAGSASEEAAGSGCAGGLEVWCLKALRLRHGGSLSRRSRGVTSGLARCGMQVYHICTTGSAGPKHALMP